MTPSHSERPALGPQLSAREFLRWYWLKDELMVFARELGLRAMGGKELLASRIAARLDGREFVEPSAPARSDGSQLSGQLTAETVIPRGQRCSQVVRAWLAAQLGAGFHFDAKMRAFFAASDGSQTLQDALEHWHATRALPGRSIDAQFEYNRFTRAWHSAHPTGSRAELLAAWRAYRNAPIDERGRA